MLLDIHRQIYGSHHMASKTCKFSLLRLYSATGKPFVCLTLHSRSTFFAKSSFGFTIAAVIDVLPALPYIETFKAFTTIYVVIILNIASIADDISMTADSLNLAIDRKMSVKDDLKQIVELHSKIYK